MKIRAERVVPVLLGVYFIENVICAVSPYDRTTWLAESLTDSRR